MPTTRADVALPASIDEAVYAVFTAEPVGKAERTGAPYCASAISWNRPAKAIIDRVRDMILEEVGETEVE